VGNDIAFLERICKHRLSRKLISSEVLNRRSGFFSKVDKWIIVPSNNRFEKGKRLIVTVSSNFHYTGRVVDIRTAISINTISDFSIPSLQHLLSSLSF